ncbi:hypothetical protein BKA62DRAFT_710847 [Auriculariales sp. MPI-PUGE-AT-0066]|nr:hypothetical protein BKA62DRAFT_710847 [Auriculariales sp. MPI-PUGE-AT-0066]
METDIKVEIPATEPSDLSAPSPKLGKRSRSPSSIDDAATSDIQDFTEVPSKRIRADESGTASPAPEPSKSLARIDMNNLSEHQRWHILSVDPLVKSIANFQIKCNLCDKWIQLGSGGIRYRIRHWFGHIERRHKRSSIEIQNVVRLGLDNAATQTTGAPPKNPPSSGSQAPAAADEQGSSSKASQPPSRSSSQRPGSSSEVVVPAYVIAAAAAKESTPKKYNYHDEIPEPFVFPDSDNTPPPVPPPRFRRAEVERAAAARKGKTVVREMMPPRRIRPPTSSSSAEGDSKTPEVNFAESHDVPPRSRWRELGRAQARRSATNSS